MNKADAPTLASHGPESVARKDGRLIRGQATPTQPVNEFLHAMREDWDNLTLSERIVDIRQSLLFIMDPVSELDGVNHILGIYTIGELYHARLVLLRLLPYLVAADADAE